MTTECSFFSTELLFYIKILKRSGLMKHTKRWVSLLLAVMVTVAAPLSAFAAWEDGFVIPGQNGSSNSYDDELPPF